MLEISRRKWRGRLFSISILRLNDYRSAPLSVNDDMRSGSQSRHYALLDDGKNITNGQQHRHQKSISARALVVGLVLSLAMNVTLLIVLKSVSAHSPDAGYNAYGTIA